MFVLMSMFTGLMSVNSNAMSTGSSDELIILPPTKNVAQAPKAALKFPESAKTTIVERNAEGKFPSIELRGFIEGEFEECKVDRFVMGDIKHKIESTNEFAKQEKTVNAILSLEMGKLEVGCGPAKPEYINRKEESSTFNLNKIVVDPSVTKML